MNCTQSPGRPSIPPERLLKASLLIALYSVRSDRLFCEMLDYNILFRWFLDMNLEERGLDQSNFSRLRERLVESKLACRFFDAVVGEARKLDLLSDEHFTVDGTLIEAWASTAKSMRRKDGPPDAGGPDDQGMVNIRGERRSNATHTSATDPDAKLMRKSKGKESKLSYGGHALGNVIVSAFRGNYDYGGEEALKNRRAAGDSFGDFGFEQQGDILQDYYKRLVGGCDVSACEPYLGEVRAGMWDRLPPAKGIEPLPTATLDVAKLNEEYGRRVESRCQAFVLTYWRQRRVNGTTKSLDKRIDNGAWPALLT